MRVVIVVWCALAVATGLATASRPLPVASNRPAATGPAKFVDPAHGSDRDDGSKQQPWRTLQHAVTQLRAGDTLYLRGGTYFEHATVKLAGTSTAPITIRAMPGELVVVDGGPREFVERPASAWEPVGRKDEFRSTATYVLSKDTADARDVWVVGHFIDSMIPLHGYKYDADFRATNEYWNVENTTPGSGIYVGPGVWYDRATQRVHIRLGHTTLKSQGTANYRGPTDPRKVALSIGIDRTPLAITGSRHLRIQDLVVRGSAKRSLEITDSTGIELDGVTIYGGSPAVFVKSTTAFRFVKSTVRGLSAPWSSRASMKYRGNSPYLFIASNKLPQNTDWEIANSDFTDSHDGLVIDNIKGLKFHHNWLDNFNDDAIYLTLPPRDAVPEDIRIYENRITRAYTALAFAEGKVRGNTIGTGVYVYRNLFDLRDGTYGWIAKDAATDAKPLALLAGRVCGDHGTPTWEPLFVYHNTVITAANTWRNYYGALLGVMGTTGSKRRVFNNMFVQLEGDPGMSFQGTKPTDDLQVDGNLLWSVANGPQFRGDFFAKHRASGVFETSKDQYAPGWAANDIYADPRFTDLASGDVRIAKQSAAIDAGIALPASWPDSLRSVDRGKPDLGALPLGAPMLRTGRSTAP